MATPSSKRASISIVRMSSGASPRPPPRGARGSARRAAGRGACGGAGRTPRATADRGRAGSSCRRAHIDIIAISSVGRLGQLVGVLAVGDVDQDLEQEVHRQPVHLRVKLDLVARPPSAPSSARSRRGSRPRAPGSPCRGSAAAAACGAAGAGAPSSPVTELRPEDRLDEVAGGAERHLVVAGEDLPDQVGVGDPDGLAEAEDLDRDRAALGVALLAVLEEAERVAHVAGGLPEDRRAWAGRHPDLAVLADGARRVASPGGLDVRSAPALRSVPVPPCATA